MAGNEEEISVEPTTTSELTSAPLQQTAITTTATATATATATSTAVVEDEITNIKQVYGSDCKIIKNIGAYKYIVKVLLKDYNVTVKFQIPEHYPRTRPVVILSWKYLANTDLDDGLRSLIMTQNTLTTMLHTAKAWLTEHTHLLSKNDEKPRQKKEKKRRNRVAKEEEEEKKKPSMKTATDVISRIQWDSSLEADLFTVGYIDRFLGIVEKSFSILSWDDPASVDDHEALAIPKHRIEYFKYRDLKVWDKKSRTDYVFGSSGGKKLTIYDVINAYDDLVGVKPQQEIKERGRTSNSSDYSDSDDDDDGIQITMNTSVKRTECEKEADEDEDEDEDDSYWGNKLRPNYFVCVHIKDEEIRSMVDYVQDILITREPRYESCCIDLSALHVTLCTMRLNNVEQVQDAKRALEEFRQDFTSLKTTLKLNGTDTFNDRVLYAKIRHDDNLLKLVDCIKLALRSSGIELVDGQHFVPHMTIMKTSRPVSRQIGKQIPKSVYAGSENVTFGSQEVDNINLCEMGDAKASDGFYHSPLKLKL